MKNLVIGAIKNYSFQSIWPFVGSLLESGFAGDIVLLANNIDSRTVDQLIELGVIVKPFYYRSPGCLNSWARFWPVLKPLLLLPGFHLLRFKVYKNILNLADVRFLHAYSYIKKNRTRYDRILLTDVRDVFFQADPFSFPLGNAIEAYLEVESNLFGSEPMNDTWIVQNYGPQMLDSLRGQNISCCGTIMGDSSGMLLYLEAFIDEFIKLISLSHGADTSIHNVVVHQSLKNKVKIVPNLVGSVATLNPRMIDISVNLPITGHTGRVIPILHQYDRIPQLLSKIYPVTDQP